MDDESGLIKASPDKVDLCLTANRGSKKKNEGGAADPSSYHKPDQNNLLV